MVLCQKGECAKMRFLKRVVQSFLTALHCLQCVIITSLWSYLKLQNAIQHEKHVLFSMVTFIFQNFHSYWYYSSYALLELPFTPFCPPPLWTVLPMKMVLYSLNVSHLPHFGAHTPNYTSRYTLFILFSHFGEYG